MPNPTRRARAARAENEREPIVVYDTAIAPGERATVDVPIAKLYTHTPLAMPVQIVHGRKAGPRLFLCAAIHGDELNGVEVIRRVMKLPALKQLRGALLAIPIVNVHGLVHRSRYLPDRRDLNRSFPGSGQGSLAARHADLFMNEIVSQCSHGIDLHTGAQFRANLPQVRADLEDPEARALARAFGAPVVLHSDIRDGSLRQAAEERNIPVLVYEAGEALRFDEVAIRAGVRGIMNAMRHLGMLPRRSTTAPPEPIIVRSSSWVRAPESGVLRSTSALGTWVKRHDRLGVVADPFGERESEVPAPYSGIVIGRTHLPLVNEGDALFHIARSRPDKRTWRLERFQEQSVPTDLEDDAEPPLG